MTTNMSYFFMLLIVGLVFILIGYLILFNVSSDLAPEKVMLQAMIGMGLSILGAIFLMTYIYKRSR